MSDARELALANYRALLAKVDAKFDEIRGRNLTEMKCQRGCHSCCRPGLTISAVEAAGVRRHLAEHLEAAATALAVERENPHAGTRCSFLTQAGDCSIYEARPIVCRSHGVPIAFKPMPDSQTPRRDVCPLNFDTVGVDAIPAADVLNIDTLNTILALINAQFNVAPGIGDARTPLTPSSLMP